MAHFSSLKQAQKLSDPSRPIFTWDDLVQVIAINGLHILGRHLHEEERYAAWAKEIRCRPEYKGSIEQFVLKEKLHWTEQEVEDGMSGKLGIFRSNLGANLVKVAKNDWPYSIPQNVEHWVVWVRVPLVKFLRPPADEPLETLDNKTSKERNRIIQQDLKDGLSGGVAGLRVQNGTKNAAAWQQLSNTREIQSDEVRQLAAEIHNYVVQHWPENKFETLYFLNPPRLQSVKSMF